MDTIKLFLASSIVEFRKERYELAAFINSLNNGCVRKDVYLEIKICEELSNAVAMERKQDEYHTYIRESDFVVMLFGKSAGKYTIEEFDVACEQWKASGSPKILTYFKQLPEGENADKSVLDIQERLEQLGQHYSTFTDMDSVKRNLLSELSLYNIIIKWIWPELALRTLDLRGGGRRRGKSFRDLPEITVRPADAIIRRYGYERKILKYIKIFITPSIEEFENESNELETFVGTLNNIYVKRDIFFELKKCVDPGYVMETERRQNRDLAGIRNSQYFYLLFGRSTEKYVEEEFDAVLEQFQANGSPKIYTYFKQLPDGESADKSVLDFMERLDKQLGHYYSKYVHLDAIKLNLILELTQDKQIDSVIEFQNGQVLLDKQPVLSLENVPFYSENENMEVLR